VSSKIANALLSVLFLLMGLFTAGLVAKAVVTALSHNDCYTQCVARGYQEGTALPPRMLHYKVTKCTCSTKHEKLQVNVP